MDYKREKQAVYNAYGDRQVVHAIFRIWRTHIFRNLSTYPMNTTVVGGFLYSLEQNTYGEVAG
jgi:hypothetical protein